MNSIIREKQDPDYYYLPDSMGWSETYAGRNPGIEYRITSGITGACLRQSLLMLKKAREQQEEMAKQRRTASDGLSVADHEVYTSDPGRHDGTQRYFRRSVQIIMRNRPKDRAICV